MRLQKNIYYKNYIVAGRLNAGLGEVAEASLLSYGVSDFSKIGLKGAMFPDWAGP
jgi:hypothetical protein